MAYWFGDGFDLYGQITDAAGYWDATLGSVASLQLGTGRFPGSRGAVMVSGNQNAYLLKTSGVNDSVHHVSVAVMQTSVLSGTNGGWFFTLFDGATAQCSVMFLSNGNMVLTSGITTGTTLATWTGAIPAAGTWYQYEIEVVINNTTGSIAVRRLGNTVNDFSATNLNTRNSANNYANKFGIGNGNASNNSSSDDILWRSDASSLAWLGDIRCYTRMPVSDASVQFTRSGGQIPLLGLPAGTVYSSVATISVNAGRYIPFTAPCSGNISSLSLQVQSVSTSNLKAALFAYNAGAVGAPIGTASAPVNATGIGIGQQIVIPFGTPPPIVLGTQYFIGWIADATGGGIQATGSLTFGALSSSGPAYASWPGATPPTSQSGVQTSQCTITITPSPLINAAFVADYQQDGALSYVYSSTVGQSDLYNITPLSATPGSIIGVTTRAYMEKSDAGTRIAAVQLQSGAANVQASLVLNTVWGWAWRSDQVDPNTSAAWTATGVNSVQIGPVVTA